MLEDHPGPGSPPLSSFAWYLLRSCEWKGRYPVPSISVGDKQEIKHIRRGCKSLGLIHKEQLFKKLCTRLSMAFDCDMIHGVSSLFLKKKGIILLVDQY